MQIIILEIILFLYLNMKFYIKIESTQNTKKKKRFY